MAATFQIKYEVSSRIWIFLDIDDLYIHKTHCNLRNQIYFIFQAGRHVRDLFEDLRDGHNLLSLLEVLSGEILVRVIWFKVCDTDNDIKSELIMIVYWF